MRLIDPAPGEVIDRITILHLKMTYGKLNGSDVTHWRAEMALLLERVNGWALKAEYFNTFLQLASLNAALWALTDELNVYADEGYNVLQSSQVLQIAQLGLQIATLNRERANVVSIINQWMGRLQDKPREKQ